MRWLYPARCRLALDRHHCVAGKAAPMRRERRRSRRSEERGRQESRERRRVADQKRVRQESREHGYMSPEYALDGVFSTKSDVFSFGVLVLEIVSGSRNRGFTHTKHDNNLIGHAWRVYNEGRSLELIDSTLDEPSDLSEVLRSIEVGLLCVQQSPEDRPDMSSVVRMLGSESALQKPKQPAFFTQRNLHGADFSSSTYPTSSTNDITATEVVAR